MRTSGDLSSVIHGWPTRILAPAAATPVGRARTVLVSVPMTASSGAVAPEDVSLGATSHYHSGTVILPQSGEIGGTMPVLPDPTAPGHEFRHIVLAELASRDLSRGWLASRVSAQPGGCSVANIYHWLRGDQDIGSKYLAIVFRILGLNVSRY